MKKIIALALCAVSLFTFAACSKYTCDMCGEEKRFGKNTEEFFGQEIVYCDDCAEALEDLGEALN